MKTIPLLLAGYLNLTNILEFPALLGSSVSINPQGDIEFEFPSTDNAAFYRIGME